MLKIIFSFLFLLPFIFKAQFWEFSQIKKLSINKFSYSEKSAPFVSANGNEIYFVETFNKNNLGGQIDQDIYHSKKGDSSGFKSSYFIKPKNFTFLNNKLNNAIVGMSSDNNTIYLLDTYRDKKDLKKGLCYSKRVYGKWQPPVRVKIPSLNITGDNYGFFVHPNEQVIMISYKGPESLGREDLYISIKKEGSWSVPVHLSKTINSKYYEISPFLSISTDTLYFSSNRKGGQGSADIYYSVKKDNDIFSWSKPKSIEGGINTRKFDAYFQINADSAMYWCSNRSSAYSSIYTCKAYGYPALSAFIEETKYVSEFGGKDGSVTFSVKGGVKPYTIYNSNILNGTLAKESISESYKLEGCKSGVWSFEIIDSVGQKVVLIDTIKEPTVTELVEQINLPQIRHPRNEWTFVQDDKISSLDSLEYLYTLLMKYPSLKVELSSHTDARGNAKSNQILSNNRAKACYKYLVEKRGVDPRRIIPVGKGKSEPLKIFDEMSNQMILLNESYINQFESDVQKFEDLHQLNRRTEVRILDRNFNPVKSPKAPANYLIFEKMP